MANRTDEERNFYQRKLSSTNTNIVDLRRDYYKSLTSGENTVDSTFLALQNTTDIDGATVDMWKEHLEDTGFSSNVVDGQRDYFEDR